ncbi:PREDICTED: uncharacterized protein LOC109580289 [Amphimedon queenslandica]|uniref:Uncharacterized protein n=1 Tax=Amphimedon queenslandica TaxID=400682 RepID=A0A1X7VIQ1_AMPQE|nr:PREDICTED: uncharacterized protein LOC109580289 [Amphimedon queenslandica]|eukprot:XP_019848874.1 PREDICTED: uncharacterized protein LOC109580289 [Amphimedon queenslandica]
MASYSVIIYNLTGLPGKVGDVTSNGSEEPCFTPTNVNEKPSLGWAISSGEKISGSFSFAIDGVKFQFEFNYTIRQDPVFSVDKDSSGKIMIDYTKKPAAEHNIAHCAVYIQTK